MSEHSVSFETYDNGQSQAVAKVHRLIRDGDVCKLEVEDLVNELANAEGPGHIVKTIYLWQDNRFVCNRPPDIARPIGLHDYKGASYGTLPVTDNIPLRIEK